MKLGSFLSLLKDCQIIHFHDREINGINYDHRKIKRGHMYFAINIFNYHGSERDGHEFINEAIKNGAKVIVVKNEQKISSAVTQIVCHNPRAVLESVSAFFYGYPAKKIITIGVTGTKGKTSTVHLINHFLEAGHIKTGLFSTANFKINSKFVPNYTDKVNETHLTCPESLELQKSLNEMVKNNTQVAVIEATSHALKLNRATNECHYDIGVISNIQRDHLDFHKTLKDYRTSKEKLFLLLSKSINKKIDKCAVINADCPKSILIKKKLKLKTIIYGIKNNTDIFASNIEIQDKFTVFTINKTVFLSPLIGKENVSNVCAAIAVATHFGIPMSTIKKALKDFPGVPGRMNELKNNKDLRVFIDYAHTPESLTTCLNTLRQYTLKKLLVVFGCAGDRDPHKRSLMGKIATDVADYVIITSEDPRNENPLQIAQEIVKKVNKSNFIIEIDRKKAIEKAISMAQKGDTVIITGKGNEEYFETKGKQIPWSDKNIAQKSLAFHN